MPRIDTLVTHSGWFHADEVLSAAVLSRLFPAASLVRTRDPRAFEMENAIVFDVGSEYDPARNRFDHHQRGAPIRQDGTPFSSFGLIWKSYGMAYIAELGVEPEFAAVVFERFEQDIVLPIDQIDNGIVSPAETGRYPQLSFDRLIANLNPTFDGRCERIDGRRAEDARFENAMILAGDLVEAYVAQAEAELRAGALVRQEIQDCTGPVLVLRGAIPFDSAIAEAGAEHILFVVYPRDDDWALAGVRRDPNDYPLRQDLPAEWAGLEGLDLVEQSGVPDAIFCHQLRFFAVAGSREGALRMAELAMPQPEVDTGFAVCG